MGVWTLCPLSRLRCALLHASELAGMKNFQGLKPLKEECMSNVPSFAFLERICGIQFYYYADIRFTFH